jgi:ataxia telangiectasia mutated family protein
METMLAEVPSFRFVPLAYQIFSRIASGTEAFQRILKSLVHKMCAEHPYHCIVQLMALSNGDNVGTQLGASMYRENVDAAKIASAKLILRELEANEDDRVKGLVKSYDLLVKSYIDLALAQGKVTKRKDVPMSDVNTRKNNLTKNLSKKGVGSYTYPPCILTQPPTISPNADYGDGHMSSDAPPGSEFVVRFDMKFDYANSGLSRPKFVWCHGSGGTQFRQVVKGNDDMRGDAVMQQVFCFVNGLMKRRDDTSKRSASMGVGSSRALKDQLKIVTFQIVPLSPAAGVLEFVKDSVTIGDYLSGIQKGDVGAHSRYCPGELSFGGGKAMLKDVEDNQGYDPEKKRQVYEEVRGKYSPVFRYFFTERFGHSLPLWYSARMKYTRSCAVNSIVGHMLGIGDRHISNILVHKNTGECVHIDFGIIFEQGKVSPKERERGRHSSHCFLQLNL